MKQDFDMIDGDAFLVEVSNDPSPFAFRQILSQSPFLELPFVL